MSEETQVVLSDIDSAVIEENEAAAELLVGKMTDIKVGEPGLPESEHQVAMLETMQIQLEAAKDECDRVLGPEIKKWHGGWKFLTGIRKRFYDYVDVGIDHSSREIGTYKRKCEQLEEIERQAAIEAEKEAQREEREMYAENLEAQGLDATSVREAPIVPQNVYVEPLAPKLQKGSQTRTTWKFKVVNESKVPRNLLCVDEKAVGALVRTRKDKCVEEMAGYGIEVYAESKHHVKKGK